MAKYDWALIKREYVQGYTENGELICPTLEDLCERHGCSISTIMKKSASEKWKTERKIFGRKKEKKIADKKVEILAEESASIDNKALQAADIGITKGLSFLDDKGLSIHDFNKVSQAISNFHRMGKLALGEPTEHTHTTGSKQLRIDHDINIPTDPQLRARGTALIQQIRTGQMESSDPGNGGEQ